MKALTVKELLNGNSYPGRGILIGKSGDGKNAVIAYFIMGRSENSRNRVFVENELGGIKTQAFDPAKMADPSLIIYNPVSVIGGTTVVTNGDQTDTVYDFIKSGGSFEDALKTREFEPDKPNYTPRISGIAVLNNGSFEYKLSILKSAGGNKESCERFTFDYSQPLNGLGHLIHTYMCDGDPIPSFEGEPKRVELSENIEDFANILWESLDENNKVSLFVRYINIENGNGITKIFNKNN